MLFLISFLVLLDLEVLGTAATQPAQCYQGEEASWELKRWVLTELAEEEGEEEEERKTKVKFYETEMFHVKPGGPEGGGAAWYLLGDGWQV